MDNEFDLIIVGGGIAGSAAALRGAQYEHLRIGWLLGDRHTRKRSRSQWVANIDNMIGIHDGIVRGKLARTLRGPEFKAARETLAHGHEHISTRDIVRNTVERVRDGYPEQVELLEVAATAARKIESGFEVQTGDVAYRAPAMVLATGAMDRQPLIRRADGDEEVHDPSWIYPFANRETVLYCIRCEGHLTTTAPTAVLGHAEAAAQLAMMLHERYGSACSVITNGETPSWSERSSRLLEAYSIVVREERIVDVAGERGDLRGFVLDDGTTVAVRFALVALGLHRVYNDLARQLDAELADPELPEGERHVLINARGETSVPGLFAVGDMAKRDDEPMMKQVYTAQEYAVRAVDTIDARIRQERRRAVLS